MKLLLIGGTLEARILAGFLAVSDVEATVSLAGSTQHPAKYPIPTRRGGFGGAQAQRDYIAAQGFDVIVDASHPFAQVISRRSEQIAQSLNIPYLRLLRPAWLPQAADNWHMVTAPQQAADIIPQGARILLATGAKSIADWAQLGVGRTMFCRRVDAPSDPFPFEGDWIVGRPPFSYEDELALLQRNKIDWIVAKNAGGPTDAKLMAARKLNIPVLLLERPERQDCPHVETAEDAVLWLIKQYAP